MNVKIVSKREQKIVPTVLRLAEVKIFGAFRATCAMYKSSRVPAKALLPSEQTGRSSSGTGLEKWTALHHDLLDEDGPPPPRATSDSNLR